MKNLFMLLFIALTMIISGVASAQEATNNPTVVEVVQQASSAVESSTLSVVEGAGKEVASTSNAVRSTGEEITETVRSLSSSLYEGAKTAISDIAKALEVPAEYVFKLLVRQQIIEAIVAIFLILFMLTLSIVGLSYSIKSEETTEYGDWIPMRIIVAIVSGASLLIAVVALINGAQSIGTGLLNPEYGAIKEIVNLIK